MKKAKAMSVRDELYGNEDETITKRVRIVRDPDPDNPMEWSQVFEVWANHRDLCGSKDAENPIEEVLDEDGCGTGEYRPKEGYIVFPVSALIHSGIYLSLASSFAEDPGGWDTCRGALMLYTYKGFYEYTMGKGEWMKVRGEKYGCPDRESRPAKDEKEWANYLFDRADAYVHLLNLWNEGSCYGYVEEVRTPVRKFHCVKSYEDGGTKEFDGQEGGEWEETDSCYGYLTDKLDDINFPREEGVPVFCEEDAPFDGDEYGIPELVITDVVDDGSGNKVRTFLASYCKNETANTYSWSSDVANAMTFSSWWTAQSVAQDVIRKDRYDAYRNIVEKDKLKELEKQDQVPKDQQGS